MPPKVFRVKCKPLQSSQHYSPQWSYHGLPFGASFPTIFPHSSCVHASPYLCSWEKVQALRVHPTSKLGAECWVFSARGDSHLVFGDAQWLFWRTGGVTAERSHRVLHRGVPPCNANCHHCSWIPPAEGQLEAPLAHTPPLGCRVWFSVPTVISLRK